MSQWGCPSGPAEIQRALASLATLCRGEQASIKPGMGAPDGAYTDIRPRRVSRPLLIASRGPVPKSGGNARHSMPTKDTRPRHRSSEEDRGVQPEQRHDRAHERVAQAHDRSADIFERHAALLDRFGAHRSAKTERRHAEDERDAAETARQSVGRQSGRAHPEMSRQG